MMNPREIFLSIQKLHPTWRSFIYWPELRSLTVNEYMNGYAALTHTWTGNEVSLDVPTKELIAALRAKLESDV